LSLATGTVTDADDIIQYVLRANNFSTLGTVIATSDAPPSFSFIAGTMTYGTTYYISAIAGNNDGSGNVDVTDPCLSISLGTPIVFNEIPTALLAGGGPICQGGTSNLTVELTGDSPWTVVYQASGGMPITVTANTSPFQIPVSPTATSTYSLVSVTNADCPGTVSGSAMVAVNSPPTVANIMKTCDAAGLTFVISFQIQGGNPSSYVVTPSGTLVGNMYTSNPLPDGTTYSYAVDDMNGCGPTMVTGSHLCNCTTDAGNMTQQQLAFCVDEMAVATPAAGEVLDANDTLGYVLHTGNSNSLGTIIAASATPSFSFNATTMTVGTVYYISSVAGNDLGNGTPNPLDPCFQVAVGTPVVFRALPTISIAGTTTICDGESANLTLTVTGTGPFTVVYSVNGAPQAPQVIPIPGTFPIPPITVTTTVTLVSITDTGTGCANTSTQSATVTVLPNVGAGTSLGDLEFCEGAGQTFDLDDQLMDATAGGQWTGPGGTVVAGGNVNPVNFSAGVYVYTYTVQGSGNCPDDMISITLTINPGPVADAGQDQVLTCDILSVPLGGTGTATGFNYIWTGGTVDDSTAAVTATSEPGSYTLTVESLGCESSDEVIVTQSASVPNLSIVISDVSCFGSIDGFLEVDSVWGGVSPYMFSLDGSPFSSDMLFTNLGPGPHTIQVVDASGCETESSFTVEEPVEVTVEIAGNFEGNTNVIDLGDELILSIIATPPSNELDSIIWSTQGIDSCQTCPSITVTPTQQTTYTVLVDEGGCTASDDLTVVVKKDRPVYVPNAFSPNDDGINDVFTIYAGKSVSLIKSFLVFNRWGESVYQYFDFVPGFPAAGWNGKHRDEKMQPAVFTWFAEIEFTDGRVEIYKGDVTLVR
jgi:gliding motility-associated-like protein